MNRPMPTLLNSHIVDHHAVITLCADDGLDDFKGHFQTFALLPGVSQIDWAVHFARHYFNDMPPEFGGMDVIKFQQPILPNSTIVLTLDWVAEKQKLQFNFSSVTPANETVIHSSGKINMGNKA
ncbi:3-hydroxyacyl-ACP dehydratase [Photobacterium kishitanii]|uniref:3-hydroxyacyl-ACP dehydratase n=2 Tax=Photobacterium kishitanii TaxID=318456 RepID=A0A0B7JHS4_9GAMM|nr:3-hydroxyacyl-ACP dehydratase [Photobacterium kishitanii]PSU95445.1 3-hydroxyacyl-ACP dehydratase [Photobacterium kishitanii]PSV16612.1 3-hydroxyacyl-ACP dehydratase [Photobacterium kishitanii]CEO41494.1 putative (3R)-hydroxymyristoyl-(Acyl carrier protein) dehydratase [Photobacterium kishitanii]